MSFEEKFLSTLLKTGKNKQFTIKADKNIEKSKLFYVKKDEKYNFVKSRLEKMKKAFLESLLLDSFCKINHNSTETFVTFGMITNITGTKITSDAVYLVNNIDLSNEVFVKLNLSKLKWYTLFSGQIVAVTGKSLVKGEILVEKINCVPGFEFNNMEPPHTAEKKIETLDIRVIAGPFDQNTSRCAIETFFGDKFDVAIICGPFCSKQTNYDKFVELQDKITTTIKNWLLKSMSSKVVIVPSVDDCNSIGLYPQPANPHEYIDRVFYYSNPSSFYVNNILVGVSTFDTLLHLAAEECVYEDKKTTFNKNDPEHVYLFGNGKLDRLATHLIHQCSYIPTIPINEPINYTNPQDLEINRSPDIFITTSKLRYFTSTIGPTRFVNMGYQSNNTNKMITHIFINDYHNFRNNPNFLEKNVQIVHKKLYDDVK
ncbi:DNA polymerase alpha subunit B [Binucleata daphniae]